MKHFAAPEFWHYYRQLPEEVRRLVDLIRAAPDQPASLLHQSSLPVAPLLRLDHRQTADQAFKMSEAAEKLRTELANLTNDDRAELAHFLINSLDQGSDADAEEAWDAELARRVEEVNTGQANGEPAEKVFSELRQKYS